MNFCDSIDTTINKESVNHEEQNASKKFSFLQKNNRRSSAPGRMGIEDFIPLSNTNLNIQSNNIPPKSGFSFFQMAKNKSLNNNNNNNNNNNVPLSSALSSKLGIVNIEEDEAEETIITGIKKPLNLLELEQMNKKNKKNKRKTIDQNDYGINTPKRKNSNTIINAGKIPNIGYEINTKGSVSISSLQSMFKKK